MMEELNSELLGSLLRDADIHLQYSAWQTKVVISIPMMGRVPEGIHPTKFIQSLMAELVDKTVRSEKTPKNDRAIELLEMAINELKAAR